MHADDFFTSARRKDRPALLVLCLLLSILFHLLFVLFIPFEDLNSDSPTLEKPQPTIVRLVDKPETEKKINYDYELDQKPLQPAPEPPTDSTRLAEENQRVKKEMAPKGDDTRDQQASTLSPKPQAPSGMQKKSPPINTAQVPAEKNIAKESINRRIAVEEEESKIEQSEAEKLPTIDQLIELPSYTVGRIVQKEIAAQQRIRERSNIETGDTVWLNLTQGRLISFFRRFRNQIEGVWNYPREAVEKEIQGQLLLKITIDRDGELVDVDLLRSSGYDVLDFEAIQAVYRAAPFGPLGKHYQHPDLKIMAHFEYRISGKYIYGEKR